MLSVEALRKRGLKVERIILSGYQGKTLAEKTNPPLLRRLTGLPVKILPKIKGSRLREKLGRKILIAAFSLLLSWPAAAEDPLPHQAVLWSFFIPGGGHFRQGEWATGAGYAATELSLLAWGYNQRKDLAAREINAPYLYALQIHNMGLFTAYRNARRRWREKGYEFGPMDETSTPRLVAAPFRWKYMSSPWVYGSALAGVGINFLAASLEKNRRRYQDITDMRIQGRRYERGEGAAAYHAYWIPVSLGAGVSEEMLFRGMIQNDWEQASSPRAGLIGASALFGLAHLDRPREFAAWTNAGFAFLAGLYLGWRYQANDYQLSESIAAHAWFDITAGVTLFLVDPENNPLGVKVQFSY
jgi:membrane protease YdiL (CAAX protease family)